MRTLLLLGLLGASSLGVAAAHAQPTPAADPSDELDEAARLLFEDGTRAYDAGRFDEARGRYVNAYELSGRPELLYNIASCHDRLDEKEQALANYERFLAELPDSSRAAIVSSRIEVLRRSVASDAAEPPDTDSDPVDGADPVDSADPVERHAAAGGSRSLVGPIASFAVAGAGLVTFAVAGLIANSRYNSAETDCLAGTCNEDDLSAINRGALIADIGLGLAIAGAAVGVVWLIVGGKKSDDSSAGNRPSLSPTFSAQHAGLSLQGAF